MNQTNKLNQVTRQTRRAKLKTKTEHCADQELLISGSIQECRRTLGRNEPSLLTRQAGNRRSLNTTYTHSWLTHKQRRRSTHKPRTCNTYTYHLHVHIMRIRYTLHVQMHTPHVHVTGTNVHTTRTRYTYKCTCFTYTLHLQTYADVVTA